MTSIQEKAIPSVLDHRDMIACAQTGTGKTAAFALPILHMLNGRVTKRPRALILSPTRELAQQTFENFKKYGRYMKLRAACIFGGSSQSKQIGKLREGCDILIATPGRLLDFINQNEVTLEDIQILVLDEADRMLDMGFIPDVKEIVKLVPADHQTLMFSATMPSEIESLARELLRNPVDIRVAPQASPAETVDQRVCFVNKQDKNKVLKSYLDRDDVTRSIIFARTKHGADKLVNELATLGIDARAIHGDKTQGQRKDTLQRFRTGQFDVLVATDVMARGIDVKNVSHVFNYDMPREAEDYIHRIGRSGRAGESGQAITFCSSGDAIMLRNIEKLIGREIPEEKTEWTVDIKSQDAADEKERRIARNAKRNARRDAKRASEKAAKKQSSKKAVSKQSQTNVDTKHSRRRDGHKSATSTANIANSRAKNIRKARRDGNGGRVELGNSVRNVRDEKSSRNSGYFVVGGKIVTKNEKSSSTKQTSKSGHSKQSSQKRNAKRSNKAGKLNKKRQNKRSKW